MDAPDLVVNRWRKYGKDRLYVVHPEGETLGFWDLKTDTAHPEDPAHLASLAAAVQSWHAIHAAAATATVQPTSATPPVATETPQRVAYESDPVALVLAPVAGAEAAGHIDLAVARPWVDLATNQPGEQARDQAVSARDAAPIRTVLARVLGVHNAERAWRIGADGEEKVAAQLAKVAKKDPRWRFLHAIPIGNRGSDIDHLIIGPGGVFTANAKNHPGAKIWVGGNTFMVNGTRTHYVRNARYEAECAAKLLTTACAFPVHVQGLIVTVNADDIVIKTQPDGVHVTWRNNLAKWLLRHGDVLTAQQIDAVYEVARRSTTWQT